MESFNLNGSWSFYKINNGNPILVGIKEDGSSVLYDIIHIKKKKIVDAYGGKEQVLSSARHLLSKAVYQIHPVMSRINLKIPDKI